MNAIFNDKMQKATELSRAGRLKEALALLRGPAAPPLPRRTASRRARPVPASSRVISPARMARAPTSFLCPAAITGSRCRCW